MLKKIFAILLICYISGCSPNYYSNQSTKSHQAITTEKSSSKNEQECLKIFLKDYDESKIDILKKYYFDFDDDGNDELVILFCDLKNNTYSNIGIVTNNFIYKFSLDANNRYRFIKPIESSLNNKEIQVKLQNINTQEKLNYHLTLKRISESDASLVIQSEPTE